MQREITIEETYNDKGVCIKRTANGKELPADTEPSVVFLDKDFVTVSRRIFMTQEEFNNIYK